MAWHDSWDSMSGVRAGRAWMTQSEMFAILRNQGFAPTKNRLTRAFRRGFVEKPPFAYGLFRYSDKHLEQFRNYLTQLKRGRPHVAT